MHVYCPAAQHLCHEQQGGRTKEGNHRKTSVLDLSGLELEGAVLICSCQAQGVEGSACIMHQTRTTTKPMHKPDLPPPINWRPDHYTCHRVLRVAASNRPAELLPSNRAQADMHAWQGLGTGSDPPSKTRHVSHVPAQPLEQVQAEWDLQIRWQGEPPG